MAFSAMLQVSFLRAMMWDYMSTCWCDTLKLCDHTPAFYYQGMGEKPEEVAQVS